MIRETNYTAAVYTGGEVNIVGTCSLCGGPVVLPKVYMSTSQPVPTCCSCGATKKAPVHGPIIDMVPRKWPRIGQSDWSDASTG